MSDLPYSQRLQLAAIAARKRGRHLSTWADRAAVRVAQKPADERAAEVASCTYLPDDLRAWFAEGADTEAPAVTPELWDSCERSAAEGDKLAAAALMVLVLADQE